MKGFKVYPLHFTGSLPAFSGRRDLYAIHVFTGLHRWQCADQEIKRASTYLCIGNPQEADNSMLEVTHQTGYGCLFTAEFVQADSQVWASSPWASLTGSYPRLLLLGDEQSAYFISIFQKMLAEQQSAYRFKDELLRSYLNLVLHEATRLCQPVGKRRFRYYFQLPVVGSALRLGWGSHRHRGERN